MRIVIVAALAILSATPLGGRGLHRRARRHAIRRRQSGQAVGPGNRGRLPERQARRHDPATGRGPIAAGSSAH